jgi:pilus assembly protein CpaD
MTRASKQSGPARSRAARPATAVFGLALAAAALSGCTTTEDEYTGGLPADGYRTQYPIVLAEGAETLDIPVGFGSAGLSPSMRNNVRVFAAEAAQRGTSTLVILSPAGSGNVAAATAVAREARSEAIRGGMTKSLVELRSYPVADRNAAAPVRLSYNRIKAMSPPCGQWTGSVLPEAGDDRTAEFGCATQANLAAMVANPEDLITPRAQTAIPGDRRIFIRDQWLKSGNTSTGEDLEAAGASGGS